MRQEGKLILRILILIACFGVLSLVLNFYRNVALLGSMNRVWETEEIVENQIQGVGRDLSYEQKLGQVFISGISGVSLTSEEKEMLENGYLGGVILFSKNIVDEEQLIELTDEISKTATVSGIVPFISVDQEGGQVSRIDWIEITSQKDINEKSQAYNIAKTRGEQLKELGFNMNFAPVADFNYLENSFILEQERAFSFNEEELVVAMVKGYEESGIVPVVKHYPFVLGKTVYDPHEDLPEIDMEKGEFEEVLRRGKEVLNAPAVMASHVMMPKIDFKPTSISKKTLTMILKEGLNYEGLIIIDDILMGAIKNNYELSEYCKNSVLAGGDIIIVSEFGEYKDIWESMKESGDDEFERRLDGVVDAIIELKESVSDGGGDLNLGKENLLD